MKSFNGYEQARESANFELSAKLPEGAYVVKIMNVRYETGENGLSDRIQLQFDISEGDQKDFFKKQYEQNTNEDKKWKGKTTIYVPSDDGSEKDSWTINAFAKWTAAFEDSNSGYVWDWDESKWKGKTVGLVFGTTGTVINGKEITYTEARFPVSADRVRSGSVPKAKFKKKNGWTGTKTESSDNDYMTIPEGVEEEIPF